MKNATMLLSLLALSTSSVGFAALIEDGASFTGTYRVQEQSCEKTDFSYVTGQNVLIPDFTFQGTPEGLKVDGTLMQLGALKMFDHGSGIQTGSYAEYVSGTKFEVGSIVISQGQKTVEVDDYVVEGDSQLTKTQTITVGNAQPTVTTCHFLKQN